MAEDLELNQMQGNRKEPEPDEYHVTFQRRKLTKDHALEVLKTLHERKGRQKLTHQDPETRTQAALAEEAADIVIKQVSALKAEKWIGNPFDADAAFDKKMTELRAEMEEQRGEAAEEQSA